MEIKKLLLMGSIALGLLATGCSSDTDDEIVDSGAGVLRIKLVGEGGAKSTADYTAFENKVNKFTVYVFNDNTETLEAMVSGTVGATTTISGLSTGFAKKVVIVANAPTTFPILYAGELYSYLSTSAANINLDYQSVTSAQTNGLVMSGEQGGITLSATTTTEVTIPIKRIVAKVTLGAITLIPTEDYDPDLFEVTGVSMQRANSKANIFGDGINDVSTMYGGVLGSYNSAVKDYLQDALNPTFVVGTPLNFGNYFYVFPNSDADNCTLMTVAATYNGDPIYFPIKINHANGNANTDGMLIERNKSYILNLTINHLADGTTDPDVPPTEANLDVNISVADWDLIITQNEVW